MVCSPQSLTAQNGGAHEATSDCRTLPLYPAKSLPLQVTLLCAPAPSPSFHPAICAQTPQLLLFLSPWVLKLSSSGPFPQDWLYASTA